MKEQDTQAFLPRVWIDLMMYAEGGSAYRAYVGPYGSAPEYLSKKEAEHLANNARIHELHELLLLFELPEQIYDYVMARRGEINKFYARSSLPTGEA